MSIRKDHDELAGLVTSVAGRVLRLGALTGQVGLSMAGSAVTGAFRSLEGKQAQRSAAMLRSAMRMQEVFGRLKGAPMKLGQMLSLHEGLLPDEIASVFRALQDQAPPVAMGRISAVLKRELGDRMSAVARVDAKPCAAASIGQIHRAVLHDGREVVFKVQYPGIDQTIESDMKTLKGGLKLLLSWFTPMDTEAIWTEVRDRLREEIDYRHEAENLHRMQQLWAGEPAIHIPQVIDELSTRRVLCMESLVGLTGDQACAESVPQPRRDQWAQLLFQFLATGLFVHRFLHADPNLANFAFCDDGSIIVYDFGCVKVVPQHLAEGYAGMARSLFASRYDRLPGQLQRMGIARADGSPIAQDMVVEYAQLVRTLFRRRPPYRFGETNDVYERSIALGLQHWHEAADLRFPGDIVFIHRTFAGHFGNLCKFHAAGPWRDLLENTIDTRA